MQKKRANVLIVDDDNTRFNTIKRFIAEKLGLKTAKVKTYNLLKNNIGEKERFDYVFLDYNLNLVERDERPVEITVMGLLDKILAHCDKTTWFFIHSKNRLGTMMIYHKLFDKGFHKVVVMSVGLMEES